LLLACAAEFLLLAPPFECPPPPPDEETGGSGDCLDGCISPHATSRGTFDDELVGAIPPTTPLDEVEADVEADAKPIDISCPGGINAEFLDGRWYSIVRETGGAPPPVIDAEMGGRCGSEVEG